MWIKDRLLICTIPFLLIFGAGLYNNRSISDFEVFSKRYWDFTSSNDFDSPYSHFLIGLTVIINRGLMGGDELVSNAFELLGSKNLLIKLIRFWDSSPPGTPTLTILFLILTFCKLYSTCTDSNIYKCYEGCKFQKKDALIDNLDHDLGRLVKSIVKSKQDKSQKNNGEETSLRGSYFADEISGLENSINSLSHISSEITESLYNFISAFHIDQNDFPDSNELSNFWSETVTNKLQNNLIRQSNTYHGSINQIPFSNQFENNFPVQNSPNFVSHTSAPFSTAVNNGQSTESQNQVNSYLDGQTHQRHFSSEAPPVHLSGDDFVVPRQIANNTEINKYKISELDANDTFLQDKNMNGSDTDQVEYNGGTPNVNTTYEFNSNIYSSLI
ncbi:uncharacterized protein cubi_02242 [Cryptosporidium ubiquitum]|uniref:Uncharacterized protein n=1 Tax=Cryptosporidium ubiquitum TaxID=857276 RepID=A0A1J4MHS6_9CRYT|nr:uncharacterized protein cubi_02242 [Cryptosporidium ubiquitum]OII73011.1 hypothetical protein cubi_02242 [Cryptosporidium ubiquitum]